MELNKALFILSWKKIYVNFFKKLNWFFITETFKEAILMLTDPFQAHG